LEDLLLGVQIGLETHRRKNIGGKVFQQEVHKLLDSVVNILKQKKYSIELRSEEILHYERELSKKVDFVIYYEKQPLFGIEVNYYTVPGSKPTEIKRSYAELLL
ncbi:MAG: DpnII family type II restriction endonuclease, partial [bacterium]